MTQDHINQLKGTAAWEAFEDHVRASISRLNNLDDIDFTDQESAAILGQGRKEAIGLLRDVLEPFMDFATPSGRSISEVEMEAGL